jgi:catechol 2,3-dioxygenase-like lactoylglutathione lyase family enzyme
MEGTMAIVDTYPLITVSNLQASRDFFVHWLDLRPIFEASWVVMLGRAGQDAIVLGLMASDHPSQPPGPEPFDGLGMIFTVQVDDARALHARAQADGAPIHHPLTDSPWGQRRFMLRDPSGILVDVVEQIEPAAGFWDAYTK